MMTPRSGFYGLLDPRGRLTSDDFNVPDLPPPRPAAAGCWLGHWSGPPLEAGIDYENHRGIAFHGVLHNRRDLARQLSVPEDIPTTQLLLRARAHWPDEWTARLDGLYAVAYWTGDGSDLTLRRDISGMLGLFYTKTDTGGIAFCSHLGTLMRLPGVVRRLGRQGLHEYLHLLDIAAPNTIFEGVRAVPAGEGVRLDAHRPGVETLLPPSPIPAIAMPFEAALDELQTRLTTSINRRLDGKRRPAAFLSGGIDSSVICALAAKQHPELEAVTVGFDLPGYDETPIAQGIAQHLGLRHQVLRFERADVLRAVSEAGLRAEQPMADPAAPVTFLAFERARQDYDAMLEGTGADEQLGAMPPRHLRVAVQYAARIPEGLRRYLATTLSRLPALAAYAPILDFEHPAELMRRWRGFSRTEIEALCGGPVHLEGTKFFEVFGRFPRGAHYDRFGALMGVMPSDRLSQGILLTGLDVRLPFCAPEVDALLRGQPRAYRWQVDAPKRILRAVLARHVPPDLWDVPKHGFNFPLIKLLSHENYAVVRHYLLQDQWSRWQLVAPTQVAEHARRFMSGEARLSFRVWALVVLAAWLEAHLA
jgi:asparagine synthase (glutamine-hydrolysing)